MNEPNNDEPFQSIDEDQLVAALDHLGVEFIAGNDFGLPDPGLSPAMLLSSLANSDEARIRMALIPLFILHPEFSSDVHEAMRNVLPEKQHYLKCYYLAASLLQQKRSPELETLFGWREPLPPIFDLEMAQIKAPTVDEQLRNLAKLQSNLSNKPINWFGTYNHAYSSFVTYKMRKIQWQK